MPDASQTTSFIPKNANKIRKPRVSKRIYVFSYISYVLFFGTIIAVMGVYFYSYQLKNSLEDQREQLAAQRKTFSESEIEEVRELEKKILLAERILNESSAPSKIFTAIEAVIADAVYLTTFEYKREDDNTFMLTFEGAVDSFDSAMFQRDLFETIPVLASARVSDFAYGEVEGEDGEQILSEETLSVTFESIADSSLIPYTPVTPGEDERSASEAAATSTDDSNDSAL